MDAKYQIVYENLGSDPSEGTITLEFDENLTSFDSANPSTDGSTISTISFNYSNLESFEKRYIDVTFNTLSSPTVNDGDKLIFQINITPNSVDIFPEDNTYVLNQPVVNTYVENEKQVLQGEEITIDEVGNYLDYIIRFQNIGTASAENIAITDILNLNLDWDTINIISSSHDFITKITDSRFVEFIFENIHLPAKQDDELGSRAFIAFRVKPTEGLVVGSIVSGKTEIFYDFSDGISGKTTSAIADYTFSESVVFNTVSTKIIAGTLSVAENYLEKSVILYPNPATTEFRIKVSNGLNLNKITLYSVTGEQLFETTNHIEIFDLVSFNSGVYFIKLETDKGIINKKLVKN